MKTSDENILHYEKSGSGPVVVLLHGYLSSLRYWDTLKKSLENNHTVIAIDLLGFGNSPKPRKASYSYREQLDWISRTFTHAQVAELPITIVGHSMGSLLALRYASENSTTVTQLFLLNLPLFKNSEEAHRELAGTNLLFRASLYWQLHRLICPVMRTTVMQLILRRMSPVEYRGMVTYMFSSTAASRNRSLRNVIESQESLQDLSAINIPTTIIVGSRERKTYQENIRQAKSMIPSLHVITTQTGHHTLLEKPDVASGLF